VNDLAKQIDAAFNYRGDVTLTLTDGTQVVGFLGNRELAPHATRGTEPFVEVYVPSGKRSTPSGDAQRLLISSIASVDLTGMDHAATSEG
jgi:hypothetical protein